MKLYYSAGTCALSPHIALEEAGLPYEAISAPVRTKVLPDGSDYRQVNPLGYVPYLVLDDGTGLREGPAIVQYIADQVPGKNLAGKPYLMGDDFTVADGYLFTVTNWAKPVGLDISGLKNLAAYRERIAARPAVQAAMKAEGLI